MISSGRYHSVGFNTIVKKLLISSRIIFIRSYHPTMTSSKTYPQATESRKLELASNYQSVLKSVEQAASACVPPRTVRLVAVSKFQPSADLMALYDIGVRHFGENYVQELIGKGAELPLDICWHFIGGLQSGKCKDLAKQVDNLYAVEAMDSLKKCKKLDSYRDPSKPILISLQINTSGEEQKSGYSASDLSELFETVDYLLSDECKSLKLKGLMTIGSFAESTADSKENEDFACLCRVRDQLQQKYDLSLQLSMGMSNDYVQAIKQGSDSVRVGTKIFGGRPLKK